LVEILRTNDLVLISVIESILTAERMEGNGPTVLTYGHGDTVRGLDDQWREGLSPWVLTEDDDRGDGEAEIFAHHAHGEAGVLLQHRPVLAGRGREDAFRGLPPKAQDAHFVAAAAGFFALFGEDLLHLGAVVAAKFRWQQAHQELQCARALL